MASKVIYKIFSLVIITPVAKRDVYEVRYTQSQTEMDFKIKTSETPTFNIPLSRESCSLMEYPASFL
jgi:hypothetical protein